MQNTILITGGAGFIGSAVAEKLLDNGERVIIVDNINDSYDQQLKRDRLKNLEENSELNSLVIEEIDITDYQGMNKIFTNNKIHKVFHAAAESDVRQSFIKPFSYEQNNLLGFLNILELMRHHNVKDLVFSSSSSVYGANSKTPFSEKDKTEKPISLYGATKKSNELMAYTYHHLFGLNVTGLRFFSVYGPWSRPDMAMLKFALKMKKGEEIDIYNNGRMKRDFTYIDDIVQGVISALNNSYPFEIFNLAYGRSIQLINYIFELEKAMGIKAKKNFLPLQPGEIEEVSADISKAQKMLNYIPQTPVEIGVEKFTEWFKGYYGK